MTVLIDRPDGGVAAVHGVGGKDVRLGRLEVERVEDLSSVLRRVVSFPAWQLTLPLAEKEK